MPQETELYRYLERYRGDGGADGVIVRAANALHRYGVETVAEAAALDDEQIMKMRGVGVKTKALIRRAGADYRREQPGGPQAPRTTENQRRCQAK